MEGSKYWSYVLMSSEHATRKIKINIEMNIKLYNIASNMELPDCFVTPANVSNVMLAYKITCILVLSQ